MSFPETMLQRLRCAQVVAGFSVDKVAHAVPVVKALQAGGVDAIELTLRTPQGMNALREICSANTGILVGVGTILTPEQAVEVKAAGADFGVAPGMNPRVIQAAKDVGLPFGPGVATPSELETAIELECRFVKFFPAEANGGIAYLRSMSAPYKHLRIQYFPLGGLNAANMLDYLKEPNVPVIGGSWIVKQKLVDAEDWAGISASAQSVINALK